MGCERVGNGAFVSLLSSGAPGSAILGSLREGGARRGTLCGLCLCAYVPMVSYRSRRDDGVVLIKVGSGCQGCVHFPNRTCKTWPDDHVFPQGHSTITPRASSKRALGSHRNGTCAKRAG